MPFKAETETKITKTCPSCSDAAQELFYPSLEAFFGNRWYYATGFPLITKINRGGLPTEIVHRCTNCGEKSTWDLVQTDMSSEAAVDYTLRAE